MVQDESFSSQVGSDTAELWLTESLSSAWASDDRAHMGKNLEEPQLPCEFPYVWNFAPEPNFSSTVESMAGSQERDSEDDDLYVADLAERIAHAMLDDDNDTIDLKAKNKNWAAEDITPWPTDAGKGLYYQFSGSEIWSGSETWSTSSRSSTSSSQGSSQNSSPPSTPLSPENDPWDVLYPAAVEVAKTKESDEVNVSDASLTQDQGHRAPKHRQQAALADNDPLLLPSAQLLLSGWGHESQTKINSFPALPSLYGNMMTSSARMLQRSLSAGTKDSNPKFAGNQSKLPKQTSVSPWGKQNNRPPAQQQSNGHGKSSKGAYGQRASWSIDASPSQWPPLQSAGGSGLRAVFLGSNASGRESAGTGVFLPRPIGTSTDTKRKPGCSTVLLPSRVVQALNLNVDDVRSPLVRSAGTNKPPTSCRRESNIPCLPSGQQTGRNNSNSLRKPLYSGCSPLQQACPEIALPTEWTY